VETEQNYDIWIYNLVTKGVVEMISPLNGIPTYSRNNKNGFASSILAWLGGANQTTGLRTFQGFQLYSADFLNSLFLPPACVTALTATIDCDDQVKSSSIPAWRGPLGDKNTTDSICDSGYGNSVASYFNMVQSSCAGYNITDAPATMLGGYIWQGYNETCAKDPNTGSYCNGTVSLMLTLTLNKLANMVYQSIQILSISALVM
jgi:hypothetical protein